MRKFLKLIFLFGLIFFAAGNVAFAVNINLNIREGNNMIFSGPVTIPTEITSVLDSEGGIHELDPESVLAILLSADGVSEDFEVSEITYFSSFGSLYLKCINSFCDDWQYVVDGNSPSSGIDQETVSGGETVWLYFGPTSKIEFSADNVTTNESLTVSTQKYDYKNNAWVTRDGVIVGLTQPDPENPFSPLEIMTGVVDVNGQTVFSNIPAGSYDVGIKEDFYFPTKSLTVTDVPVPPPESSSSGGSGGRRKSSTSGNVLGAETKIKFDLEKAFEFLIAQQQENGSFGENLFTDWAASALDTGNHQEQTIKLIKYLGESKMENPRLTDYERRAMALMSLGLNPYNTLGENYIEKIANSFDGAQFGENNEDNDDIFALIVLSNAGYGKDEIMMEKSVTFVLKRQKENGSWDESVDMTGAALVALAQIEQTEIVKNALNRAKDFLKETQKKNGGWGDSASSTAWALEGIGALGEKPEDWEKNENTPLDFLATIQDTDGGIKNENLNSRIWETAYVVSTLSGKTWNEVLQKFEKREIPKTIQKPK